VLPPPIHPPRGPDRRRQPTPRLSRWTFVGGRRRSARRAGEQAGSFVDLHEPRLLALVMWIALLNLFDTFFTIVHLQRGGVEFNPVAEQMLLSGRASFVVTKGVVIGLALLVLTVHKNYLVARAGLWLAALAYTLLTGWHLALFFV
jgi:hypothetical protein